MVESRQPEVLAIIGTFTVVASLTVFLRVWSRYLGRNFCWDDHLILIAFVLLILDTLATWMYIVLSGTGYHVYDLPKKSVAEQLVAIRWNFAVQMMYHPRTYIGSAGHSGILLTCGVCF
jgi:structural maintenance of chromosome 2